MMNRVITRAPVTHIVEVRAEAHAHVVRAAREPVVDAAQRQPAAVRAAQRGATHAVAARVGDAARRAVARRDARRERGREVAVGARRGERVPAVRRAVSAVGNVVAGRVESERALGVLQTPQVRFVF